MRDRFVELLPLLLVAVILIGYQYVHGAAAPDLPALAMAQPTVVATPTAIVSRNVVAATVAPAASAVCSQSQPRFVGRFALLRAAVGAQMGDAVECEHEVDADGDTHQKTSTGLAYYLKARNLACFTTGYDHWAVAANGAIVTWSGDAPDPPQ